MTPEREKLIRDHWPVAVADFAEERFVRVPVRRQMPAMLNQARGPSLHQLEILVFELERGTMDGSPWLRVVCEGILVEEGPDA